MQRTANAQGGTFHLFTFFPYPYKKAPFPVPCILFSMTPYEAFELLDLRVGRIVKVEPNEKARKPSYKLWLELGPLGTRQSSAQLTELYTPEDLLGRLVICAVNLGERNIAGFVSQALVLGLPDDQGHVALLTVEREVPLGGRVY